MNNRRMNKNRYKRRSETRELKKAVLILCQGKETEPNYFNGMKLYERLSSVNINIITKDIDPLGMIKHIIKLKKRKEYDEIWCVFDIDQTTEDNVNEAFKLADDKKIKIAYSNESFELWYILHFEYLQSAIHRKQYIVKLSKYLKAKYQKNDKNMYEKIIDEQETAIKNAQKLLKKYAKFDPFKNNPSTTVHNIILELKKLN